jgi:hypothetical protein
MSSIKKTPPSTKKKQAPQVAVAGIWELGWNTPIKEIDLWEYPLREYGVDKLYMTPISGIDNNAVIEKASLEEILAEHRGWKVVFCDERAKTTLKHFNHPKKALYVFGKANFSPFLSLKRPQDLAVKIESSAPEGGMLWPHQAAAIILYDRLLKARVA